MLPEESLSRPYRCCPPDREICGQESTDFSNATFSPGLPCLPEQGKKILIDLHRGNLRYVNGCSERNPASPEERRALSVAQYPDVIAVSCSDSRVNPADIFDMNAGTIFEIGNAGEIVCNSASPGDSTLIGSIEYMVNQFVAENRCGVLLILGHDNCGAVGSALAIPENQSAGSPHLDTLLTAVRNHIPPDVQANPGEALRTAVKANASGVVNDLLEHSQIIRNALTAGHLVVAQASYHLDSGEVKFLAPVNED